MRNTDKTDKLQEWIRSGAEAGEILHPLKPLEIIGTETTGHCSVGPLLLSQFEIQMQIESFFFFSTSYVIII